MKRTSKEWWEETKSSPTKLVHWLQKQYHGEATAAARIEKYCIKALEDVKPRDPRLEGLQLIAAQERKHAEWVGELLETRGCRPRILDKQERYWELTLPRIEDFLDACAIAHHAEVMRLERIRVIAEDESAPVDIRDTFTRILKEELFHAKFFGECAGSEAIEKTKDAHLKGAESIGFITTAETL